jgi:hypothetical protein
VNVCQLVEIMPESDKPVVSQFKCAYEGARWTLLFGRFAGIEKTAIIDLQKILQYYAPYVLPVRQAEEVKLDSCEHLAVVGTEKSNPLIAEWIRNGVVPRPAGEQGYSILFQSAPWNQAMRLLVVAGADDAGTLYGVQEVSARLFGGGSLHDGKRSRMNWLAEEVQPFTATDSPAIRQRGLWTWGYPIRDWRGYLNNMVRLKLNTLTLWNDQVPLNIEEIIDYAHERAIQVVLGFHWGWGFEGSLDLSDAKDRAYIRNKVLENYRTHYAHLKHDGIYFQTLTEHRNLLHNGKSTAHWACLLVNETVGALLQEFPDLQIQFGLHATSVEEHYVDLRALDSRVVITWEDCGGQIPYSYYPAQKPPVTSTYEETLEYSRKIATLRPGVPFALVPKGWSCIRWLQEFENHGPFILGEQSSLQVQEMANLRQSDWDSYNAHWHEHYPRLAHFFREMLQVNPEIIATALVEDGMFEERLQSSVVLLAETLWNPGQTDQEILVRSIRPWYSRVPS